MLKHSEDALKVWWASIHRPLAGERRAEYDRPLEARSIVAVAAEYRAYVLTGGGPDAARIDEHARDYEIRLRAITGAR